MKPIICTHCQHSKYYYRCGCLGAEIEQAERGVRSAEDSLKYAHEMVEQAKQRVRELHEARNAVDPVNQAIWRAFK